MATHSLTGRHAPPAGSPAESEHFRQHGCTPIPRFIQWMATLRCGLSCPHCLAADDAGTPDMSLRAVERLLDQVAEMGIGEFLVTGGEPVARPDLPEVVAMLGERGIAWTLNTAANPGARLRAAMEKYPPAFVAVSLDGPERVHDRFRGRVGAHHDAMEAIRFYLDIVPGRRVTAGTTVTARNFAWLAETFGEVVRSGATAWGLHLLVPEGRARENRRLFLSRRKLRALVDFCAAKRNYFPVGMADEIGYLGEEEPLVRDTPFFCGAGRTQCVVLPGGEVVPCSTLDRSASAGNVLERPLAEIWAEGFAALRYWQAEGRCKSCEYAPACKGGCWLQRRNGTQCFKAVWRAPKLAATTAGLAVCFGLGAAGASAGEPAEPPKKVEGVFGDEGKLTPEQIKDRQERSAKCLVEKLIVGWYVGYGPYYSAEFEKRLLEALGKDPAADYFQAFVKGDRKPDVATRCAALNAALKTNQVSLSLAALMWRDLAEVCLDGKPAAERTTEEQKLLRDTLAALDAKAAEWRESEFKQKLGAFLNREITDSMRSKAGPPALERRQDWLGWKRWPQLNKVTNEFIKAHPLAEALELKIKVAADKTPVLLRAGKEEKPDKELKLRIFDMLRTPAGDGWLTLVLSAGKDKNELIVRLPAGCELTYPDLLRLAYEQNRTELDEAARTDRGSLWMNYDRRLLFPALREIAGDTCKPLAKEEDPKLQALIADLGADEWAKREAATGELAKIGRAALPALREAAQSKDAEVVQRAKDLIEKIEKLNSRDDKLFRVREALVDFWLF